MSSPPNAASPCPFKGDGLRRQVETGVRVASNRPNEPGTYAFEEFV